MPDLSLKRLFPDLAKTLNVTEGALYERQRALVRAGLIRAISGKGPGKGVRATPHSVAMVLISLVATPSLVEVETEAKAVASLKRVSLSGFDRLDGTGPKTFGAALTAALASKDLAVSSILVIRCGSKRYAELRSFRRDEPFKEIESGYGDQRADRAGRLSVSTVLSLEGLELFAEAEK